MTEKCKVQGVRSKVQGSKNIKTRKSGSHRRKVRKEELEITGSVWGLLMVEAVT